MAWIQWDCLLRAAIVHGGSRLWCKKLEQLVWLAQQASLWLGKMGQDGEERECWWWGGRRGWRIFQKPFARAQVTVTVWENSWLDCSGRAAGRYPQWDSSHNCLRLAWFSHWNCGILPGLPILPEAFVCFWFLLVSEFNIVQYCILVSTGGVTCLRTWHVPSVNLCVVFICLEAALRQTLILLWNLFWPYRGKRRRISKWSPLETGLDVSVQDHRNFPVKAVASRITVG